MHALPLVTRSYALLETMAIQKLQMEIVIFVTTHSVDKFAGLRHHALTNGIAEIHLL